MEISDRLPSFAPLETDRTPTEDPSFSIDELQLACRNRGMPLEALRYDVTPTGLHYLLSHSTSRRCDPRAFGWSFAAWSGGSSRSNSPT
jgi:hypothetical protein